MSMVRWVAARPRMARDDHIHLTRRGYVRMGMALADAMMVDYDGEPGLAFRGGIGPESPAPVDP